jgi:glycerophosphoryl diester phosphodiesterase
MIDDGFVDRAHRCGRWVYGWTVDDTEAMMRLIGAGVDGIVTNDPGLLRQVLEAARGRSV